MRANVIIACVLFAGSAAADNHVTFYSSKATGARTKQAVDPFVYTWAPNAKLCLGDGSAQSAFTIVFEIAADGTVAKPTVTTRKGSDDKPGTAKETTCVEKTLAGKKVDGTAKGPTTITAKFVVNAS
jgi:hypothetical protein